ncbi:hypothetical protein JCM33374_g1108 [Metschnikowia sp. JCM 33374]|nr:hypothetical protein JCM33374_g1108 [Metschnikowia sp. JCM 33374]
MISKSFSLIAFYLASVSAHWSTHYSFENGLIYLQLKNDDLVALNFSMAGFDGLSETSAAQMNIKQSQPIRSLATPPQNASMFVYGPDLYAFTGGIDDSLSEYDKCGDGIFQLLKYNSSLDSWVHAASNMTFSDVDDVSFYQDSTYFTSTASSEIYIYGGTCASSGEVVTRLLSLDMNTMSLANITTSTKPQGFYGGTNLWAPTPQQSFVIGGRSQAGWLNMYQLATWNFQSGWSFQNILQNGTTKVSSRTNALALPIFTVLPDNTMKTFNGNYNPTSVLVLGGESTNSTSSPWAKLTYSENVWTWSSLESGLDSNDILGAAVIFDTLVVVNGSLSGATKSIRSGNTYHLNLYSVKNGFAMVNDLKSNTITKISPTNTESNGNVGISKNTKVLVGTLVPFSALAIILGIAMLLWRRKVTKTDAASVSGTPEPLDYQFGHYRTKSDQHTTDSASTLDGASIDSWVRKRQEYDAKHRSFAQHSYLASNHTLNAVVSGELNTDPDILSDDHGVLSDEFGSDLAEQSAGRISAGRGDIERQPSVMSMIRSPSTNFTSPDTSPQKSVLPIRLAQLRGLLSGHTSPQQPKISQKSRLDPGFINLDEGVDLSYYGQSDGESIDENMDVQVLVSSKRKSVLRVMNPDSDSTKGVRLRAPSK